jgi:AraC-like DNA-binding protein
VLIQGAAQCSIIFLLPGSQSIHPGAFDTHTISVSFHENNVYFIPSPATISIHAKNNTVLKVLSITFSQKWLFSYLSQIHIKQKKLIHHLIFSGKDMVLYEPMTFPVQQLAETLSTIDWQQPFVNILANAKILEVLHTLLTALSTRKKNTQKIVNKADYEQIRDIVIMLSENWQKRCPSIQEVALLTHMSPTKFKKLFRTIYEKPYYSFFLHLKLLRCMELLKSGTHSVTEVAYIAGYSRPSKFSEVFRQYFKLSPSSIIKQK